MNINDKINYVEFPARDIEATKTFFTAVFGWSFNDYGPEYTAFADQGINGGFYRWDSESSTVTGGAMLSHNKAFKFVSAFGLHRTRAAHAPLN